MKKELLFILILSLIILPFISAVEIKLIKDSYQPLETLQAEISGNFINSLTIENLGLYKEGTPRIMPSISGITQQGDTYYFYAILPNQEANFSIRIEDAKYTEAGVEKTTSIIKNFTIIKSNTSVLQINPGFVSTTNDFSIKIKSLYQKQDITASFEEQTQSFSLNEDSEKTLVFFVKNITGKQELTINNYKIPVFIISKIQNISEIYIPDNSNVPNNQSNNETKISIINLTTEEIKSLNCNDIGEICLDTQECDGTIKPSLDSGSCCVGTCKEKSTSSYSWVWAILIILAILGAIFFFYSKGKKRLKPKSTDEFLEESDKRFKNRMENRGEEVSGKLDKI